MISLKRISHIIVSYCLLAIISAHSDVQAGGYAVQEIGSQRTSMKATVARGTDLTTMFSNPGGLARLKGTRFYGFLMPAQILAEFSLQDEDGEYSEWIEPTAAYGFVPFLGASSDFGFKKWVFGLSWYFPNLSASSLPEDSPLRYHAIEAYFINWFLTGSAAYELHPKVSLGAGASHIYALQYYKTMLDLSTLDIPQAPIPLAGDALMEAWPEGDGFVWNAGIILGPWKGVKFGLTYTSCEWIEMEGDLEAEGELYGMIPGEVKGRFYQDTPIPDYIRAGINYQVNHSWQAGFDWTLWHYNIYQKSERKINGALSVPGMLEEDLDLDFTIESDRSYGNSYNLAAGIEYIQRKRNNWTWTLGFEYDKSPIPDRTFSVENPTSDFIAAGLGLHLPISKKWTMGSTLGIQRQKQRDIRNSETVPPTNVKTKAIMLKAALSFSYRR